MNSGATRFRARKSLHLAKLFGGASIAAMVAGGALAQGQVAQNEEIPETVLITGSLIQGAVSVGVAVSSLSTLDFGAAGQRPLTEVVKSVPALDIDAQDSPT